ncbi:flagellar protein FlaG [Psychrobium sp. MM17-31]|uniref:flagellar protein FlaG n=1 Tax=Psychrobium sp. MM17-31 TaxID=2917758 RepID=UPI001EF4A206|nr:flagellar protein FlaG [Psychrobium sp. MM17-31]MCG7530120.1 flagellar protein FlaG [Psychrobium sp. MM17-31]
MNIDSSIANQQLSSLSAVEKVKQSNSNMVSSYQQTESVEAANERKLEKVVAKSEEANSLTNQDVSKEQLEVLAEKLQEFVSSLNKGLQFSVHEESGRDVIKVIDRESDEVVRQYPSEEVLELVAKLSDAAGNFINSQA